MFVLVFEMQVMIKDCMKYVWLNSKESYEIKLIFFFLKLEMQVEII